MNKTLTYLFALVIVLSSCRKEPTTWNSALVLPIAHGSLTLDKIIPDSLLELDESNVWHLVLEENLTDINTDSLAELPDTTISQAFEVPFSSGTLTLQPGITIFNTTEETTLGISGAELKYVEMKSGFLHYKVKSYINGYLTSLYQLPGVMNGPSFVNITANTPPKVGNTPGVSEGTIDLSNYSIDLTGVDGSSSNSIYSNLTVSVTSNAPSSAIVQGQDSIVIELSFLDAKVNYARGYFGHQFYEINEQVDFGGDINMPSGTMLLEQARMDLSITNYIGVDAKLHITGISSGNEFTSNSLDYSPVYNVLNITRALDNQGVIYPFSTSYLINEGNSNLTSFIGDLPNYLALQGNLEINPLGNISGYNDFIYADNPLEARVNLDIPLKLATSGLTMSDTIDVSIGEEGYASGNLILKLENYFPFNASVLLQFADGDEEMILENGFLPAAQVAEPGNSIAASTQIVVPISNTDLERLKNGDRVFIRVTFTTPDYPTTYSLYKEYRIDYKLLIDANVEFSVE
jgi:hypothetical protein